MKLLSPRIIALVKYENIKIKTIIYREWKMINGVRAYSIRTHDKAEISCEDYEDRLEITLKNKDTGDSIKKSYYKLETGIDIEEAIKIDTIVYHMHYEIGLDLWKSKWNELFTER